MQIQISTDRKVESTADLRRQVEDAVSAALSRFAEQLTRVEVYLSEGDADQGGSNDKRCAMEARPAGQPPVAATDTAATVAEACRGAALKLQRLLDTGLSRVDSRADRDSIRFPAPS